MAADQDDLLEVADECHLWRAVLRQAFIDATATRFGKSGTEQEEREDARRFLLSPLDPWRRDRHEVSLLAGYGPEVVEQRARAILRPLIAKEAEAEAKYVESEIDREDRLRLADHIAGGGSIRKLPPRSKQKHVEVPAIAAE